VEIVSKKLVRIRQTPIRQDPNGFIPKGERTCVFPEAIEDIKKYFLKLFNIKGEKR